jgi:hypothetical protein
VSERKRRRDRRRQPHEGDWNAAGPRPGYDPNQPGYYAGSGYYQGGSYTPYAEGEGDWDEDGLPVRMISVARVLLALLALGAAAVAFFGFLDRSAMQLPIIIVGLGLLGVSLLVLSLSLARASVQLGGQDSAGRALLAAFFGGLCILGAAGSLAGAIVLGMLTA